jgi:hypothetical protein
MCRIKDHSKVLEQMAVKEADMDSFPVDASSRDA